MNSYKDFYNGKGYSLTLNFSLDSTSSKPSYFAAHERSLLEWWRKLDLRQKKYLLILSGIDEYRVNEKSFKKIKEAYDSWNSLYRVVFYGGDRCWACNLFVGEVLRKAGIDKAIYLGKYYSARQIWEGKGPFRLVAKKEVKPGDVAAFRGTHVEIVTKINRNQWIYDDDFCSCGVGRGASGFGTERCDGMWVGGTREIDNKEVRFLRAYK